MEWRGKGVESADGMISELSAWEVLTGHTTAEAGGEILGTFTHERKCGAAVNIHIYEPNYWSDSFAENVRKF